MGAEGGEDRAERGVGRGVCLGAMAQAPDGMTVSEALTLARDHKELILPQIAAELKKLG